GVAGKIDLRLAPAADTLDQLLADGEESAYDFAFVDADKTGYDGYYERLMRLVRPGGLIAFDNTLWGGAVLDQDPDDEDTRALRPVAARHRLDRHQAGVLATHLLDERQVVRPVGHVPPEHRVERGQDGREGMTAQRLEVRRRRLVTMAGDADGPDQPLLLCP